MPGEENPIDVNALVVRGPERLATLLAEAAMTNSCMRRRLQFELSAQKYENVPEAARRWISELSEQTSLLDTGQVDELARELEDLRAAIVSSVSRTALKLAPDLIWRFSP